MSRRLYPILILGIGTLILYSLFSTSKKTKYDVAERLSVIEKPIIPTRTGKDRIICFHTADACERGTDVAIYDYADFTESILGHTSKILILDRPQTRNGAAVPKYIKRFGNNTVFYTPDSVTYKNYEKKMVTELLPGKSFPMEAVKHDCDFVYIINGGTKTAFPRYPDGFNSSLVRMGIHAVFHYEYFDKNIPYAGISLDVTKGRKGREIVHHIIRPPSLQYASLEGLRADLGIPKSSLVLCRHGGMTSFDVPFVHQTIFKLLEKHPNGALQFVFLGTQPFYSIPKDLTSANSSTHPYIHHLPTSSDDMYKERFIKTCDAMIHARQMGESFGIAVAEFSVRNKPVITFPGDSKEHIRFLGKKGFVFKNDKELISIVDKFVKNGVNTSMDYNAYREVAPEIVMKQFKRVFLDPVFGV